MPYLDCPGCRLTVYLPPAEASLEKCPRCSGRLGAVRTLFPSRPRSGGPTLGGRRRSTLDAVISTRPAR